MNIKKYFFAAMMAAGGMFAQELVQNGGFEGSIDGWQELEKLEKGDIEWSYIDYDGVGKVGAIGIASQKAGTPKEYWQELRCRPATTYVLKANLKADGCSPTVTVRTVVGDSKLASISTDSINWETKSVTFKTGVDIRLLRVIVSGSKTNGKAFAAVDDISIDKIQEDEVEAPTFVPKGENIALNKPYTWSQVPQYALCTDEDDKTQLTDGVYTKGYFWTQKTTVGWKIGNGIVELTLDLGAIYPIGGFSFNTAFAGSARVSIPLYISVFTSDDGKDWYAVGNLLYKAQSEFGEPEKDGYHVYRIASEQMPTKGRYVRFQSRFDEYLFVDEIEVYKGSDSLLAQHRPAEKIENTLDYSYTQVLVTAFKREVNSLEAKFNAMEGGYKDALLKKAKKMHDVFDDKVFPDCKNMTMIYPITEDHAKLFALNAEYLRARNIQRPLMWNSCRWDNFDPMADPAGKLEPVVVEMMRDETRTSSINITNPTDKPIKFKVYAKGMPEKANIKFSEVLYTQTLQGERVAGALKPEDKNGLEINAIPGMNSQIWISFEKPVLKAGTYKGKIVAEDPDEKFTLSVPVKLIVHDFDFPTPRLHVGGWDYLHVVAREAKRNMFGVQKKPEVARDMMRSLYVDSPWGANIPWSGGLVGPAGAVFDAEGHLTNADKLDFTEWEKWISFWKDARLYCVYLCVGDSFNDAKMGTPRFDNMVKEYFKAWANYVEKNNFPANRVVMLILDEPWDNNKDATFIKWAKPFREANTGFVLFEDPIHKEYKKALPEMYELSDILCPNRINIQADEEQMEFFMDYKRKGKTLWLYSCSGPSRLLDPSSYYRGQAWDAFKMGAEGTFFWAFGCGGGINNSWKPFAQTQHEFSPYFVSPEGDVMPAKQSEAIRESVQDYEYLCMLQDRIEALRDAGKSDKRIDRAEQVLKSAVARASVAQKKPDYKSWFTKNGMMWSDDKDRNAIDEECVKVLRALSDLKKL